jgi:uncharacterized protein (TIGR02147 family)
MDRSGSRANKIYSCFGKPGYSIFENNPEFVLEIRHTPHLDSKNPGSYGFIMNPQASNLYEFADFRKFLEDYQVKRQAVDKSFTRSRFCAELGLPNTRSYFNDILSGRKPLTRNYVERFVRATRMDEEEGQYFRVLVDFNQCVYDKERELLFEQLVALNRTPKKFVDTAQYEFYKRWYHTAVFSLLDIHDFKGNHAELAKRVYPPITPGQAQESVSLLKKLGLIGKTPQGAWKATDKTLDAGRYVRDELIKQYQLQCLELAKKILLLENEPKGARNFSTVTLSISGDAYRLIEKKLQKFKAEVRAIAHREDVPADRVYQLNIQYFPQSAGEKAA